jgi:hypothetical protein
MDRLSKAVKTVTVVIAAAVVSVPLAMITEIVTIKWDIPVLLPTNLDSQGLFL